MLVALLFLVGIESATAADFWPQFYGQYKIQNWDCQSNLKDPGCLNSASIRVEVVKGVGVITVLDSQGQALRINELVEKKDAKVTYSLAGDENSAAFIVEAFDSKGTRYFHNVLQIERTGPLRDQIVFSQLQDSHVGEFKNSLKRIFQLQRQN